MWEQTFMGQIPFGTRGGDNKNGESNLAGKAAFASDFNFNLYEYFHFCSRLMKKDDKNPSIRGRSSNSPCMIVFCSFEQLGTLIDAAKGQGFIHYIPLVFIKKSSPQALKANMRVVGATEYALLFYRDKLPKFRNAAQYDPETGKAIRGTGHMVKNWFGWEYTPEEIEAFCADDCGIPDYIPWETDGTNIPKIHPTQKPIAVIRKLIETFTDPGDVVIDPCFGSGTTARACQELGRSFYGFEINKEFCRRAREEMLLKPEEIEHTEPLNIVERMNKRRWRYRKENQS
jgi:site-specific DNA-methyltransferase (adenine-specific)